jgi:hypothetical protein
MTMAMSQMTGWLAPIFLAAWVGVVSAQMTGAVAPPPAKGAAKEIPLFSGAAPGSEKWNWEEKSVTN